MLLFQEFMRDMKEQLHLHGSDREDKRKKEIKKYYDKHKGIIELKYGVSDGELIPRQEKLKSSGLKSP